VSDTGLSDTGLPADMAGGQEGTGSPASRVSDTEAGIRPLLAIIVSDTDGRLGHRRLAGQR